MTTDLSWTAWLAQKSADATLFEPAQLRERMEALDDLDALIPDSPLIRVDALYARAVALREKLEAANSAVYAAIRDEIRRGAGEEHLRHWIEQCGSAGAPRPGLGYDHLDELVAGVLGLREPAGESVLAPEMVFYQPTPVRHILEMLQLSELAGDDVLIDLGSGLGHVPMLASILAGVRAIGIEIDPAYVRGARECAANLGLDRVTFLAQDARDADLSTGAVFHLYTPFTGGMLRAVLDRLRGEAEQRAICVCTLGPCAAAAVEERWLSPCSAVDSERITCFRSRPTS